MFLLGMLTRTADEHGAICGVLSGSCVLLILMASSRLCAETESECLAGSCCETFLGWLGRIAFFWYAGIGASVCFIVGFFRSWLHCKHTQPSAVAPQRLDGLVFGFGTTRPVVGNVGAIEHDLSTMPRQSGDSEKERLVVGSEE